MSSVFAWFGVFAAALFAGMAVLIAFAVAGWDLDRDDWRGRVALVSGGVTVTVLIILGEKSV